MSFPIRHFRPFALLFAALWLALPGVPAALAQNSSSALSPLSEPAESAKTKAAPPRNGLNKADLEFYIRHLYIWGPQIQVEIGDYEPAPIAGLLQTKVRASYQLASEERTFFVSKDGAHVFEGSIFDVDKNPFHETIEKLTTANQPSFGTAGAPVVIVVFSDFECPYCAQEAKTLRNEVLKTYPKEVRVFFHDYPLPTHNWAKPAAIAGRCVFEQEPVIFWDFHDWIFENQNSITPANLTDKVMAFATSKGVDTLKLAGCIERGETAATIDKSIEEGHAAGVSSTPTLFINGRKLGGSHKWEQLKQVIDYELDYQKVAKDAGDDCGCEIAVPFPAAQ
jgi:protein-disulfide isomerase